MRDCQAPVARQDFEISKSPSVVNRERSNLFEREGTDDIPEFAVNFGLAGADDEQPAVGKDHEAVGERKLLVKIEHLQGSLVNLNMKLDRLMAAQDRPKQKKKAVPHGVS